MIVNDEVCNPLLNLLYMTCGWFFCPVIQYLGVWYEVRKYFSLSDYGLNCSRTNISKIGTNLYRLNNTATALDQNGNKTAVNSSATGYAPNPSLPAKLVVLFGNSGKPFERLVICGSMTHKGRLYSVGGFSTF